MEIPNNIKRKFRNFGVEGLTLYILVTMGIIWAMDYIFPGFGLWELLYFDRGKILSGQVWRVISFMFLPQFGGIIEALIVIYMYYFIGTSLESAWGKTKYTLFFLCGLLLLAVGGFIAGYADPYYFYLALFLAFAIINPNMQFLLFFIIPIKVKYLAVIDAVFLLISFAAGTSAQRISIIACLALLCIFFGGEFFGRIKAKKRYSDFRKNFRDRDK